MWRSEWWVAGLKTMCPGQLPPFQEGFRVGFLYPSAIDIWGWFILCVGLFLALQGVKQNSWPPPTQCQKHLQSKQPQMSPHIAQCPLEAESLYSEKY